MSSYKNLSLTKKSLVILAIFIIGFLSAFYLTFFYHGKDEREFLKRTELAFENSNKIKIRDLTNFEWDKVCLIDAYDNAGKTPEEILGGKNLHSISVPDVDSLGFRAALSFSKDGTIIKILNFKFSGINKEGLYSEKIKISNSPYSFLTGFKKNKCSSQNAFFSAEEIDTKCCGTENNIYFN